MTVRLQPVDYVWMGIGIGVVGWNVACGEGCTLSERADDWDAAHRWLFRGIAYTIAAHVTNSIPSQMDPIHLGFVAVRKLRRL